MLGITIGILVNLKGPYSPALFRAKIPYEAVAADWLIHRPLSPLAQI